MGVHHVCLLLAQKHNFMTSVYCYFSYKRGGLLFILKRFEFDYHVPVMQLELVWNGWLWHNVLICSALVAFWIRFDS